MTDYSTDPLGSACVLVASGLVLIKSLPKGGSHLPLLVPLLLHAVQQRLLPVPELLVPACGGTQSIWGRGGGWRVVVVVVGVV